MTKLARVVIAFVILIVAVVAFGTGGTIPAAQAQDPDNAGAVQQWDTNGNNIPKNGFLGTTNNRPLVFKTNNSEKLRILPNGNVGIGTNTPANRLSVNGAADFSGNVGIGTTNPSRALQVNTANAVLRLESTQANGIAQTEYATDARRWYTGSFGSTAGVLAGKYYIKDDTTGQTRFVVDTNGNIGIGTNNPEAKIHVANTTGEGLRVQGPESGAANGAYVAWTDSSGTAIGYVGDGSSGDTNTFLTSYVSDVQLITPAGRVLTVSANGNVGVGVDATNPDTKLHVRTADTNSGTYVVKVEQDNGTLLFGVRNSGLVGFRTLTLPTTQHLCYSTDGAGTRYLATCNSAAEYVPTIDGGHGYPETADLVSIAPDVKNPYGDAHGPFTVQKSTTACDSNLLGYIVKPESGADGVKLNDHYLPLATYGYFPAKVTMENGMIKRGDPITSSSKVGYGMKATGACKVIGYALEDASAEGTIRVFANLSENAISEVTALRGQVNALTQENRMLKEQLTDIEARLAALETAPVARTDVEPVSAR